MRNTSATSPENPSDVASDVAENSWLVWRLNPAGVTIGTHDVRVRLVRRDPRIAPPLTIQHVDLWINYRDA